MNKTIIGLLFITVGVMYGSLALDGIYNATLGYLVQNDWLRPPPGKPTDSLLGRKPTIVTYSLSLIIIGIFIIWSSRN